MGIESTPNPELKDLTGRGGTLWSARESMGALIGRILDGKNREQDSTKQIYAKMGGV